jgi:RNA polymerase sigma factor (sigma-70 family)
VPSGDYLVVSDKQFHQIATEYAAPLTRLTAGYVNTSADREDLRQEILLAIWNALPRFRGDSSIRTWVYRIAHNVAISYSLRRRRRKEDTLQEHADARASTEADYADAERRALLTRAIQDLEGSDKQIVLLYLEGLRNAEIADVVGLTEGAIGTRLTRLRVRLTELVGRRARR